MSGNANNLSQFSAKHAVEQVIRITQEASSQGGGESIFLLDQASIPGIDMQPKYKAKISSTRSYIRSLKWLGTLSSPVERTTPKA